MILPECFGGGGKRSILERAFVPADRPTGSDADREA
jgi:hypothetical protein